MPTAGPVVLERTWPFVRSRTYIHGTFTNCTRNHPAPKRETPLAASPARATSGSRCLNLGQPFDAEPIQRANPVATGTTTMRVVDGKSGVRHSRRGGGGACCSLRRKHDKRGYYLHTQASSTFRASIRQGKTATEQPLRRRSWRNVRALCSVPRAALRSVDRSKLTLLRKRVHTALAEQSMSRRGERPTSR